MNIEEIVKRIKQETNNIDDIIYREKYIGKNKLYIIYNEPLTSSDKISNFIIRSLNNIKPCILKKTLIKNIENNISNFKVKKVYQYDELCLLLHKGFTLILLDNEYALALETKAKINRGISLPETENTIRGAKDSFVEEYQTNIGLIKKRIKDNNLWINKLNIGKYTKTTIGVLYINGIVKKELVEEVTKRLKKINIYGIINSAMIKNLITSETKSVFPTILTTERPDIVSEALLQGKVAIVVDNSPYVLVLPAFLNDFYKTMEDVYGKSINVSFTRIIKLISFWIALLTPAVYISLITYNQEMIPTDLLVSFATQRDGVPFPAFFEAFILILSFEMLRESDLRVQSSSGNSLSIVGALILGDASVNAGIVSPIMIIVIAITAISSLPFSEFEFVNSLRWYRLLFMFGALFMGIIGIVVVFLFFIIRLSSIESFGKPYLMPLVPISLEGLKNSFIKFPLKKLKKRESYLSDNIIEQRNNNEN